MAEVFETSVKLKFIVPAGESDRIKKIVNASMSGGLKDRLGGMSSMMGGKGMALAGALGAAGAIVMSSPSLQGTLKRLLRMVELIIKPIGDIISVGLRPIIDVLRPIGMFFRILMAPYIRKAMEAMRLGRQYLAKGYTVEAGQSYALGAAFLLKPFFDMMVTVATISVEGILAGLRLLGDALISIVPFTEDVRTAFDNMMDRAIGAVGIGGASIISETTLTMYQWLENLKTGYKDIENLANVSMGNVKQFAGEGFIRIIESATLLLIASNTVRDEVKLAFDTMVTYTQDRINQMNAMMSKPPVYSVGGVSYQAGGTAANPVCVDLSKKSVADLMTGMSIANPLLYAIGQASKNPFSDFVWRPGSKPVSISSSDTLIGTKGGGAGNITIDVGGIRIDRVSSDYDINRIAVQITDKVIDNLRSRV